MKQSNFAARLSRALDARNMKAADLSKKTKVSEGTISCYINGKYEAKQNRVRTFAEALNVNPAWLMGYDVPMENEAPPIPAGFEPLPEMSCIPLVGTIACGTPITAEENIEARIGIPAAWHADFALTCKGDSMAPRYLDGDIVCIRSTPEVENGRVAAVRIGEEATLKRFYRNGDTVTLVPINRGPELEDIQIEGCVVGFCRGE